MLTQGIKRWLSKLFGWWPWKKTPERQYAQATSLLNKSISQESIFWSTGDSVTPHAGGAPLIVGQGETSQTSLSTIDEWPERIVQASPTPIEKVDQPQPPALLPASPIDSSPMIVESTSENVEALFTESPHLPPTPEKKLEFLQYLVKRGIINEGFPEDQIPEQYKNI
ncbi:MAG: hypothetical protein NVS9B9_18480 [Ktedonobacteraceae bacterium]